MDRLSRTLNTERLPSPKKVDEVTSNSVFMRGYNGSTKKRIILEAKLRPCADCGQRYPAPVMEFDHVRGEKEFHLSRNGDKGITVEQVLEEMSKCDVVCANCHRMRHWRKEQASRGAKTRIVRPKTNRIATPFATTPEWRSPTEEEMFFARATQTL